VQLSSGTIGLTEQNRTAFQDNPSDASFPEASAPEDPQLDDFNADVHDIGAETGPPYARDHLQSVLDPNDKGKGKSA
jgi:hypothetical protein